MILHITSEMFHDNIKFQLILRERKWLFFGPPGLFCGLPQYEIT
jgi:hypothetical protein